jgi:hypothetical protein
MWMHLNACHPERSTTASEASRRAQSKDPYTVVAVYLLLTVLATLLHAQDIRIKVLNARNGKPITNECLNIWLGAIRGPSLLAPTDPNGVAVLHIEAGKMTAVAAPQTGCDASPYSKFLTIGADTISIWGDAYIACQEYGKIVPGEPASGDLSTKMTPSYSIKKILDAGVSAANTCGKFRAEAEPGELVFFERPRTWLEKWKL